MQRGDIAADVRLFIYSSRAHQHQPGFGRGVVKLCEGVSRLGSLNKAAKEMGMAYSKAWRIINNAEESLGVALFERHGARGSTLTPDAQALVAAYRKLEAKLYETANAELDVIFEEFTAQSLFGMAPAESLETKATSELIEEVKMLRL